MTIRFKIPEFLLPKLKQLQEEMTYTDEIMESEEAIVMTLGMGPAMYLTMDGRIIIHKYMDNEAPREATNEKEAYTAIVLGAKIRNAPELLSVLPKRNESARNCPGCEGKGWKKIGKAADGKSLEIICWECGGIG